jgi:membrane-associated protein
MTSAINSLLTSLGPLAIVIVMGVVFAETGLLAGFFLPGDSLLFTTGILVAHGTIGMPIGAVIVAVSVAAFAGDQIGYLIGRRVGPRLLSRPQSRLLDPGHLRRASRFFDRHGPRAVILARFVPVARTFTPPAAGAGQMPYRRFIAYNAVGAAAWCASMLGAGCLFGGVPFVNAHIELLTITIVLLSLAPAGVALLRSRLRTNPALTTWLVGRRSARLRASHCRAGRFGARGRRPRRLRHLYRVRGGRPPQLRVDAVRPCSQLGRQ